jgi:GntR family transcriptional regulator, rspAB operon transcriptional repressor
MEPVVPEQDAEAGTGGDESTSMVDGVYQRLLTAIVEFEIGAGTALSQNKLAAQLGVSRTPVREALLRLERDGLVQRSPDTGFVVASITPDEVNEACDLLEVLDSFVYLRAADRLDPADAGELLELAATLVRSAESGDTDAWRGADRRYHGIIMAAAGNRFVAEYLQQLRRRVQRFWLQEPLFDGRLRHCSHDHVTLANALANRDEALLRDTVSVHIARMRQNVLARLASAAPLLPGAAALGAVRPVTREN